MQSRAGPAESETGDAASMQRSKSESKLVRGTGRRETLGAAFNLFNTILGGGAGLVPLPHAVQLAGSWARPLLLLSAMAAAHSACNLVTASCVVSGRSYKEVAHRTLGSLGGAAVQWLTVLLLLGTSVAGIDIFADVAPARRDA